MSRPFRRLGILLAGLVALYAVAGFLVLPRVLKAVIPTRLGGLLGREVTLEKVRTNPFTLAVTLEGFQVKDGDAGPLLALKRLHVDAELWPFLHHRAAFKAIELEQPAVRVVIEKDGRLNFSDVLDRLAKSAPDSAPQESPMNVFIERLRMTGATLVFEDRSLAEPFRSTLGPIGFELERFRTERDSRSPYAFKGRTEAGETFAWQGTLSTRPLRSAGVLELGGLRLPKYAPYYQPQVGFELREGIASAKASYDFEWSAARHVLKLKSGSLGLRDLALAERHAQAPVLQCPSLEVAGAEADLLESTMNLPSVTLQGGRVLVRREAGGALNLQKLFEPVDRTPEKAAKPFQLRIGDIALASWTVQWEDLVPARPVRLDLSDVGGSLKDFSLEPGQAMPLELSAHVGEGGSLEAKGTLSPFQATGDFSVKAAGVDLPPLDPYADAFANLRLSRGRLGLEGHLKFAFPGQKQDGLGYQGNLEVSGFEARDGLLNEPFLRWKRLRLAGLDIVSQRPSVAVKNVDWADPEGRLVMAQNGVSNVARALQVETRGPVAAAVPPTPGPQPLIRIARMHVTGGRLSFIDRTVVPNAALLLSEMDGVYTGLSTQAEEATQVDFKGKAGGLAPITIQGKAMPLMHDRDTDVAIKIVGADLTDFSPYTGKYLGYTTREGKLHVDARVQIKNRQLNIEDKVVLDRMYLGDKVASPDATHLPVKLGLAILRDRKGVIELEVPIDGSLDDPDIHYGRMVWKAIFNVLGKIITSPFTLLSKMFGGGEDLSAIAFAPGSSLVAPTEQKKLETLGKALVERPELHLELEGTTDATDLLALRQRGLDKVLRQLKWNARKGKGPATLEEEVVDPSEREAWMRAALDKAFPPPKGTKPEPPPLAEVEQRLLETIQVDPSEIRALAKARNQAALTVLLQGGQVDANRVFELQGGEAAKAGGARVYFALK